MNLVIVEIDINKKTQKYYIDLDEPNDIELGKKLRKSFEKLRVRKANKEEIKEIEDWIKWKLENV